MHLTQSALVRICRGSAWALGTGILTALLLATPAPSRAQGAAKESDPHAHHQAAAAPPAEASPPPAAAPSRASAISTPSWFAGGEALYVPPYFDTFQGLDLTSLTASQKERFLHRVNTEFCSCNQTNCRRDTIAHCYVNDAACPRAPVRIREILEKVKSEGQEAGSTPPQPTVTITPQPPSH